MKKLIPFLLVTLVLFSCEKQDPKVATFLSGFQEKQLPLNFDNQEFKTFFDDKIIAPEFLYILNIDTTDNLIYAQNKFHYVVDHSYKYIIKTDKKFDLIIIGQFPFEPDTTVAHFEVGVPEYYLYTINSKTGEIYDKIKFAYDFYDFFERAYTESEITKELDVNVTIIDSITDEPDENWIYYYDIYTTNLKYKISDEGIFELADSTQTYNTAEIKDPNYGCDQDYCTAFEMMENLLTPEDYNLINELNNEFDFCNSANQIKKIINNEADVISALNNMLNEYDPNMDKNWDNEMFARDLNFIEVGYGAESCCFEAFYNYYPLYKLAETTPETDDDIYFEAYTSIHKIHDDGDVPYLSDWGIFSEEVDFETSYSNLGSGAFLEAFKTIYDAADKNTIFNSEIEKLRMSLFSYLDFLNGFTYSKDAVLEELNNILTQINLNEEDTKIIKSKIAEVSDMPNENFEKDTY